MNPAVYCPGCGNKYEIRQDTTVGPTTYEVICHTCRVGDRMQIQKDSDWELLFRNLNINAVSRVLSGAMAKLQEENRLKRAVEAAERQKALEKAAALKAERARLMEALDPVDGSYPPDPEGEPGEEVGRYIADQFRNVGGAAQQASLSMADLNDAMKKAARQMSQISPPPRPRPFLRPAMSDALRRI